jgi:hypothetical protein
MPFLEYILFTVAAIVVVVVVVQTVSNPST